MKMKNGHYSLSMEYICPNCHDLFNLTFDGTGQDINEDIEYFTFDKKIVTCPECGGKIFYSKRKEK